MYERNDYNTPATVQKLSDQLSLGGGATQREWTTVAKTWVHITQTTAGQVGQTNRFDASTSSTVTWMLSARLPLQDAQGRTIAISSGMRVIAQTRRGTRVFHVIGAIDDFDRNDRIRMICRETQDSTSPTTQGP